MDRADFHSGVFIFCSLDQDLDLFLIIVHSKEVHDPYGFLRLTGVFHQQVPGNLGLRKALEERHVSLLALTDIAPLAFPRFPKIQIAFDKSHEPPDCSDSPGAHLHAHIHARTHTCPRTHMPAHTLLPTGRSAQQRVAHAGMPRLQHSLACAWPLRGRARHVAVPHQHALLHERAHCLHLCTHCACVGSRQEYLLLLPPRYVYNCLLHLCGTHGRVYDGLDLLAAMRTDGAILQDCTPDNYTYRQGSTRTVCACA